MFLNTFSSDCHKSNCIQIKQTVILREYILKKKSPGWSMLARCDESKSHHLTEEKRGACDEGAWGCGPHCSGGRGTRSWVASGPSPHSCELPCAFRNGRGAWRRRRWRRVACQEVPQGCLVPAGNGPLAFGSWRKRWLVPGLLLRQQKTVACDWNKG